MCAVRIHDPHIKGHDVDVTLYAVIIFKGHVSSYSSYSEWSVGCDR